MNVNVNPAAPVAPAALTLASNAPSKCEKCDAVATHTYRWPWGESGNVCALHAQLVQQTAENLNRQVSLSNLSPAAPPPLTRDERSRLKGEVYALEEELKEAKQRGLDLYNENHSLLQQVSALTVRGRETEMQLRDARAENEELIMKMLERDAEHGDLVKEVERLRKIEAFIPNAAELPPPAGRTVVDG